jgi:hypothetical protein
VKSRANDRFWDAFRALQPEIREQARHAYSLFRENPGHPGLQFKCVQAARRIYSVRVTRDYRALGVLKDDTVVWFWIGNHADYDRLLGRR